MKTNTQKPEPNQYDKVIKEALRKALPALLTDILKLPAREFKPLHIEFQRTIERKADFIGKLHAVAAPKTIAHLEIQAKDERKMVARAYLYSALILNAYPEWDLIQVVFYIGKNRPRMKSEIQKTGLDYRFRLIWVKEISYRAFLESEKLELMLLAILADHEGKKPGIVMEEVVNAVRQKTRSNLDFSRFAEQLHILSNLHNLQQIFENVMLNISELIDETKDPFFQRGEKLGLEKGLEQGLEQGLSIGITEKTLDVVMNLITDSTHDDAFIARIAGVLEKTVARVRNLVQNYPERYRERLREIELDLPE